jgi:alpha-tubulin suppressor-like RCC1 family protein
LGNGSNVDTANPVTVYKLSHATALSLGVAHACAVIDDGTVACWGSNGYGELGDGTYDDKPLPTPVVNTTGASTLTNVVAVSAGSTHTCVLLNHGDIACFGEARQLQFGGGNLPDGSAIPVRVPFTSPARSVVAGIHFTCALINPQSAECVGANDSGQLGIGRALIEPDAGDVDANKSSANPLPVKLPAGESFKQLLSKYDNTCLLSTAGELWCWGFNDHGQAGIGSLGYVLAPAKAASPFGG